MRQQNIIVYGFGKQEINIINKSLPTQKCQIIDTDFYTDLIAVPCFAQIINSKSLKENELDVVLDYYSQIGDFSETVIFIGEIDFPKNMDRKFIVYNDFGEFSKNIKYSLLGAYGKHKKSSDYSEKIANSLKILNTIRNKKCVTTNELTLELELSNRTVQRYIQTLRVAGEWINYDFKLKGWFLQTGKSILWGDELD